MQFTLTSDEGLAIRGDLDVPAKPSALVVVVHGFKGFKDWGFFPWLSQHLCASGFAACRFNMSRSGIGDDPESFDRLDLFEGDTYSKQLADLRRVVVWAQEQMPGFPTFLLGHSRGGGIALLAARAVPHLKGVIVWSPISRVDRWDDVTLRLWQEQGFVEVVNARTRQVMRMSREMHDDWLARRESLDILAATSALDAPLLVVHGGRDESVPVEEGRLIASASPQGNLAVIGRGSHTFNAIHPLVHVPFELSLAAELSARFVRAWANR